MGGLGVVDRAATAGRARCLAGESTGRRRLSISNKRFGSVRRRGAIVNEVGHEQCEWEKDQAEDEVADEAVPLSPSNACGPERQRQPNSQENHHQDYPAEC
jgi:hypothetical protein